MCRNPCLFENIVLVFDHNDYVLSRRDSLIVNCQLLIVNYKHQFIGLLTIADKHLDLFQGSGEKRVNGGSGGFLLRALLAGAQSFAHHRAVEADFHIKPLVVVGARLTHQLIGKGLILSLIHI